MVRKMRSLREKRCILEPVFPNKRRVRTELEDHKNSDFFDRLPDDLVLSILSKFISSVEYPIDFVSILLTCKRFRELTLHPYVLSRVPTKSFSMNAKNWSDSVHMFLQLLADAGNTEACYFLGMIVFYCLKNYNGGALLITKAAMSSHPEALYSLAIIYFNGSGRPRVDKDIRSGVSLCARAASFGHINAFRELGHCLQDGYGICRNLEEGRRLLLHAESLSLHTSTSSLSMKQSVESKLNPPVIQIHPVNKFMSDWFDQEGRGTTRGELKMCSHVRCGRPETRQYEFRRCSVCGKTNYCSRFCQSVDWKLRHKAECTPSQQLIDEDDDYEEISDDEIEVENEER